MKFQWIRVFGVLELDPKKSLKLKLLKFLEVLKLDSSRILRFRGMNILQIFFMFKDLNVEIFRDFEA